MTLLEKAESIAGSTRSEAKKVDAEELLELALAFLDRKISRNQVNAALTVTNGGAETRLSWALWQAIKQGKLTVVRVQR
jgi:hypothetical protein